MNNDDEDDNYLDNDNFSISTDKQKIIDLISAHKDIKHSINVKNIIRYIDTTLYILSHSSLEYEEEIRLIFKNYHRRFTVEITTITINLVEDELEEYNDDDDTNNKLVNYAVKNSNSVAAMVGNTKSEAEKLGIWEKARQGAVYRLDDTILMSSRNRAAQEVTCIGLLYVTVADATAQKEINFKVKQTTNGKIIVSVNPFLF